MAPLFSFISKVKKDSQKIDHPAVKVIHPYEVLDSRGLPTVACLLQTTTNAFGKAMVPSGASTGAKEALELRDSENKRYLYKGVRKAINNVREKISPRLIQANLSVSEQSQIDQLLNEIDGTGNKSNLGANATLAVSLACAKAAANSAKIPLYEHFRNLSQRQVDASCKYILPTLMVNVINGGAHADNTIDFQEFMLVPIGAVSMHGAVRIASECFHHLQQILKARGLNTNKGDEGGFAPNLRSVEEVLSLLLEAIGAAGYRAGEHVALALDVAASEFYDRETKRYVFKKAIAAGLTTAEKASLTSEQMVDYLVYLTQKYPIISVEDGLAEDDYEGFKRLTSLIGDRVQIVGDDLYCTNPELTRMGIAGGFSNAVLVKLNQIGTVSETIQTVLVAQNANWSAVVSHRSGETEDTTIADLAVGLACGQIKTGSMSRSERIAKYNRLLEIENELNDRSVYLGLKSFKNLSFYRQQTVMDYSHAISFDLTKTNRLALIFNDPLISDAVTDTASNLQNAAEIELVEFVPQKIAVKKKKPLKASKKPALPKVIAVVDDVKETKIPLSPTAESEFKVKAKKPAVKAKKTKLKRAVKRKSKVDVSLK